MNRPLRTLLAAACLVPLVGCSAIRGEQVERGFAPETTVPTTVADTTTTTTTATSTTIATDDAVSGGTGDVAATGEGAAPTGTPTAFVGTELVSGSAVDGRTLLDGAAIVTFVTADCEFSGTHAELLRSRLDGSDDVTQVFVHGTGDRDAAMAWVDEMGLVGEHVVHLDDSAGALTRRFSIDAFPTTILVNAEGELGAAEGALDAERLDLALAIVRG